MRICSHHREGILIPSRGDVVKRNSTHGQQLTPAEKKHYYAVRWWDVLKPDEICETLSIAQSTFRSWTSDKQKQKDAETKQTILDMHLACYTQQAIADAISMPRKSVADIIANFGENDSHSDLAIFRNFEERKIYTVWNFPKATNEIKHFGNIPPDLHHQSYRRIL